MKKFISFILAIVTVVSTIFCFSSCSNNGLIEADASEYLTKGEWFNYFVSETGLSYVSTNLDLTIDSSSEYYDAVMTIVDNEIIDAENACKKLDETVTKDTVAYTCVNYMQEAFRKKSETVFKDEDEITDPEAAAEAVDYGYVESSSNSKFGPNEYMSIEDCETAIDKTIDYLTNYTFSEDENNTKIIYKDNVYDINDDILSVEKCEISDYDDYTEPSDDDIDVSLVGLKNSSVQAEPLAASKEDVIVVVISTKTYKNNPEAYKVGNIIKFNDYEVLDNSKKNNIMLLKNNGRTNL